MTKSTVARLRAVPKVPARWNDVLKLNRAIWDEASAIKNLTWAISDLDKGTGADRLDTTRALLKALPPHLALLAATARRLNRLLGDKPLSEADETWLRRQVKA